MGIHSAGGNGREYYRRLRVSSTLEGLSDKSSVLDLDEIVRRTALAELRLLELKIRTLEEELEGGPAQSEPDEDDEAPRSLEDRLEDHFYQIRHIVQSARENAPVNLDRIDEGMASICYHPADNRDGICVDHEDVRKGQEEGRLPPFFDVDAYFATHRIKDYLRLSGRTLPVREETE
ncbi:hypothetical protein [Mesorhizobium sp. A556]